MQTDHFSSTIDRLAQHFTRLWFQGGTHLPEFPRAYPLKEKFRREALLDQYTATLLTELQSAHDRSGTRQAARERITQLSRDFAVHGLDIDREAIDRFLAAGFRESALDFARRARHFDSDLSWEDIYQAGRNVWSMNLFQYFFGLPVQVTPAIFAYSLLYPYTDNYLDNPEISADQKRQANERLTYRLGGHEVFPENSAEEHIYELVGMIEGQFPREKFPQVYASLLSIHQAQVESLRLIASDVSPYELDVLGLSLRKGGAATLADGYLVAGELTPAQEELAFGYGAFTQLMDDQEDIFKDREAGLQTIFSQTAQGWKLDGVTSRLFAFKQPALGGMYTLSGSSDHAVADMLMQGIDLLLIEAVNRARKLHHYSYVHRLEAHFPLRFSAYNHQRRRLLKKQALMQTGIELFLEE